MPHTHQTSKHKWRREKFWAFMLLGLNHSLYHDPLPPWGFEFLIWINCQAWWHYTHYGFKTGHEPQSQDTQEDDKSSSDKASVGERPERRASGDEQEEPGDRDPNSGLLTTYYSLRMSLSSVRGKINCNHPWKLPVVRFAVLAQIPLSVGCDACAMERTLRPQDCCLGSIGSETMMDRILGPSCRYHCGRDVSWLSA
jgi:hypothetical protein